MKTDNKLTDLQIPQALYMYQTSRQYCKLKNNSPQLATIYNIGEKVKINLAGYRGYLHIKNPIIFLHHRIAKQFSLAMTYG